MNNALYENILAILESVNLKSCVTNRANYLSKECNIPRDEVEYFLSGKKNLSMSSIKKIADTFYVDLWWLLGKSGYR